MRPVRLVHEDGRPFSPQEHALAVSSSPAERRAAVQLAIATAERRRQERDDWVRVAELTAAYRDDERTLGETVAMMPEPERTEAVSLLNRFYKDGPPPGTDGRQEQPGKAGES